MCVFVTLMGAFVLSCAFKIDLLNLPVSLRGETDLFQYVFVALVDVESTRFWHERFTPMKLAITGFIYFFSFLHKFSDLVVLKFVLLLSIYILIPRIQNCMYGLIR